MSAPAASEVARLRVHGDGVVHHHLVGVLVELVLRLLAHGEGAGQRDLGGAVGVARAGTACRALPPRACAGSWPTTRGTGVCVARARLHVPGLGRVDALERGGEAVGVALAPDLAVGDDVDAGALHVADGEQGGVVLRLLQPGLGRRARCPCARAARSSTASRGSPASPAADSCRRRWWAAGCGHGLLSCIRRSLRGRYIASPCRMGLPPPCRGARGLREVGVSFSGTSTVCASSCTHSPFHPASPAASPHP